MADAYMDHLERENASLRDELAKYKETPCPKNRNGGHWFNMEGVCDYCGLYDKENNLNIGLL
jgi:hypothetical protein